MHILKKNIYLFLQLSLLLWHLHPELLIISMPISYESLMNTVKVHPMWQQTRLQFWYSFFIYWESKNSVLKICVFSTALKLIYLSGGYVNLHPSCFRLLVDSSSNQFWFWQEYGDTRYSMRLILTDSFWITSYQQLQPISGAELCTSHCLVCVVWTSRTTWSSILGTPVKYPLWFVCLVPASPLSLRSLRCRLHFK